MTLTKAPESPEAEKNRPDGIPKGFRLKEGGLYALEIIEDDNGNPREREIRIGAPFIVEALVRDKRSEDWERVLRFLDPDGIPHTWVCPATLLGGRYERLSSGACTPRLYIGFRPEEQAFP